MSVFIGLASFGLSLISYLFPRSATSAHSKAVLIRPRRKALLFGAATVILAIGAAVTYWLAVVKPDMPVTDLAIVTNGDRMTSGKLATIDIPGTPPERHNFAFTPTLTNPSTVGDCVGSARLDVSLVLDGRTTIQKTGLPPQEEIRMDLDGVTRDAQVLVSVDMQDAACEVKLSLSEAVLFN